MKIEDHSSACIFAVAQLLIERMHYDPEMNCFALSEEKSFITLPTGIVNACKREFEAQADTNSYKLKSA
ncbi:MAG: hypothetical protein U1C58_06115 [Flavobacteriaceae bacterium]|nr:hypothetical protein [Flavobacteriaceae bacterium]MDZ4147839.1 hypothetical protein [Flavobacteriaceae bacterium]